MTLNELQALTDEQLIERVATNVMGWKRFQHKDLCTNCNTWYAPSDDWSWQKENGHYANDSEWNPLKHMSSCWMVVERMQDQGFIYTIASRNPKGSYDASFFKWDDDLTGEYVPPVRGEANFKDSPQRAILFAALLAHD